MSFSIGCVWCSISFVFYFISCTCDFFDQLYLIFNQLCVLLNQFYGWFFFPSVVFDIRSVEWFIQSVVLVTFSISCDIQSVECFIQSVVHVAFPITWRVWYSISCVFYSISCRCDLFDKLCSIFDQLSVLFNQLYVWHFWSVVFDIQSVVCFT